MCLGNEPSRGELTDATNHKCVIPYLATFDALTELIYFPAEYHVLSRGCRIRHRALHLRDKRSRQKSGCSFSPACCCLPSMFCRRIGVLLLLNPVIRC